MAEQAGTVEGVLLETMEMPVLIVMATFYWREEYAAAEEGTGNGIVLREQAMLGSGTSVAPTEAVMMALVKATFLGTKERATDRVPCGLAGVAVEEADRRSHQCCPCAGLAAGELMESAVLPPAVWKQRTQVQVLQSESDDIVMCSVSA